MFYPIKSAFNAFFSCVWQFWRYFINVFQIYDVIGCHIIQSKGIHRKSNVKQVDIENMNYV